MKLAQISDRQLQDNDIDRAEARWHARRGLMWWIPDPDPDLCGRLAFGLAPPGADAERIEPPKASDEELRERRMRALAKFDARQVKRGRLRVRFNVGDFRANPVPLPVEAVGASRRQG